MSDVPDRIYLPKEWCLDDLAPVVIVDQPAEDDDLAFVPLSVANAMVGAAFEEAAQGVEVIEGFIGGAIATGTRALTPSDAIAALEAIRQEAYEAGRRDMREAAVSAVGMTVVPPKGVGSDRIDAWLNAIEECEKSVRALPINPRKEKDDG